MAEAVVVLRLDAAPGLSALQQAVERSADAVQVLLRAGQVLFELRQVDAVGLPTGTNELRLELQPADGLLLSSW